MNVKVFCVGLLLAAAGCSAPIQHQQPVELPARGKFQIGLGMGLAASTSALDVLDLGKTKAKQIAGQQLDCKAADRSDCLPATELREVVDALYGAGMSSPLAFVTSIGGTYGLTDRIAVGASYGGGVKAQVLYQVADGGPSRTGWQSSVALGWSQQSASAPGFLGELQDLLLLDDFGRHNGHLSVALGKRLGQFGWAQFGGQYVLSRYTVDLRPGLPILDDLGVVNQTETILLDRLPKTAESGWSHHAGAFASIWGGYKYAWLGLELAAAWYTTSVMVLGKETTYSGVALSPSLNLMTRF